MQGKTHLLTGCLLSVLMLAGCASSMDKKAQENNAKSILAQAKQAYLAEDYRQAFQLLYPLATSGNDQAQYAIGYLYHQGWGVEKSDQQAMSWIQRAAAQGNKKAPKALQQER